MGDGRQLGLGAVVQPEDSDDLFMVVGFVDGSVRLVELAELERTGACIRRDAFETVFRVVDPPDGLLEPATVRIWSFEHNAWWAPESCGYTQDVASAGLYERAKAVQICRDANIACAPGHPHEEIREVSE